MKVTGCPDQPLAAGIHAEQDDDSDEDEDDDEALEGAAKTSVNVQSEYRNSWMIYRNGGAGSWQLESMDSFLTKSEERFLRNADARTRFLATSEWMFGADLFPRVMLCQTYKQHLA